MKLDLAPGSNAIVLYNVSQLGNDSGNAGANGDSNAAAFLTLANIEEDRISKSNDNFIRKDRTITYQNPEVHLNLFLLFSIQLSSYTEALKRLSFIIQFFQQQNVFTPLTSPAMPAGVEQLILDMYTLSLQDVNNLWGMLGSKYLPSVMYKLRMITISEKFAQGESGLITTININNKIVRQ
ncbi:MAG: DUF4255 domain-containing protein [Bacteroidota bacterium]|nr:DUF4255 domain-containing protein [Bacteroidota bacterium]